MPLQFYNLADAFQVQSAKIQKICDKPVYFMLRQSIKDNSAFGNEFRYFFEYVRTNEIHPSKIEKISPDM